MWRFRKPPRPEFDDPSHSEPQRRTASPATGEFDVPSHSEPQRRTVSPATGEFDDPAWKRVVDFAAARKAIVTLDELAALGVGESTARTWTARARLHPRFRGVYLVGDTLDPPLALEYAALRSVGEGSHLSNATACWIWGAGPRPEEPEVTVAGRCPRQREGMRLRYTKEIDPRDLRVHEGLPVTSPARTIVDVAATRPRQVGRLLAELTATRRVRPAEVEAALERAVNPRGRGLVQELLSDAGSGYSRNGGERALLSIVRGAHLPEPERNRNIGSWNVDFVWAPQQVVVELDGFDAHISREAFERDRRKTLDLQRRGYAVLRFSGRQLRREPLMVAAELARCLLPT